MHEPVHIKGIQHGFGRDGRSRAARTIGQSGKAFLRFAAACHPPLRGLSRRVVPGSAGRQRGLGDAEYYRRLRAFFCRENPNGLSTSGPMERHGIPSALFGGRPSPPVAAREGGSLCSIDTGKASESAGAARAWSVTRVLRVFSCTCPGGFRRFSSFSSLRRGCAGMRISDSFFKGAGYPRPARQVSRSDHGVRLRGGTGTALPAGCAVLAF